MTDREYWKLKMTNAEDSIFCAGHFSDRFLAAVYILTIHNIQKLMSIIPSNVDYLFFKYLCK